ncbi:MAG: 50S ribosomal protein L25 [Deltaproteobacteria bacterium]|nr:50S ribosomal protein L25 [Deltaproteobacteria bacterium]NIS77464.1 50S ribosomal protein L25 [Deltaproteobacteria bacterium]
MAVYELNAEMRKESGKGVARRLRSIDKVPAVIYGLGRPSRHLTVEKKDVEKYLRDVSGTTLLLLRVDGGKEEAYAIVKDYQVDPTRDTVIHIDFLEVDLAKKTVVEVSLSFSGKPKGVEMGGTLEILKRDIEVECLPSKIPDTIEVDVSSLDIGDVLHLEEISLPEDVVSMEDVKLPVASVKMIEEEVEEVPEEEVEEEVAAEAEAPDEVSGEDTEKD